VLSWRAQAAPTNGAQKQRFVSWLCVEMNSLNKYSIFRSCRSFQRRLRRLIIELIQLSSGGVLLNFLEFTEEQMHLLLSDADLCIAERRQIKTLKAVFSGVPSSMLRWRQKEFNFIF